LHHRARCAGDPAASKPKVFATPRHWSSRSSAQSASASGWKLFFSRPDLIGIAKGFLPSPQIVVNPEMLYIAIGILGRDVMPHNLYLHSSIVQTRNYELNPRGKREAIKFRYNRFDLSRSCSRSSSIARDSHRLRGERFTQWPQRSREIGDAYKLLTPCLASLAPALSSRLRCCLRPKTLTLTGTLAGQIVMEGFLNIRLKPWLRRLLTRLIAIIPAVIVTLISGQSGFTNFTHLKFVARDITSGIRRSLSCRLRITWLSTGSFAVPLSPEIASQSLPE